MCVTMITLIIINKQLEFSETSCHSFCNALESKKILVFDEETLDIFLHLYLCKKTCS